MTKTSARAWLSVGCAITLFTLFITPLCVQWFMAGRDPAKPSADYFAGLAKMADWIGWSSQRREWDNAALYIRQGQAQVKVKGLSAAENQELAMHVTRDLSGVKMKIGFGRNGGDLRFIVPEREADRVRESIRNWRQAGASDGDKRSP